MNDPGHAHAEEKALAGDVAALLAMARKADAEGEGEKAVLWLRRAAASGDGGARAALGRHLILTPPFAFEEGVALTIAAAHAGNAEAAHLASVLAGLGVGMAQNWTAALDFLHRAVLCGHEAARAELALVGGDIAAWLRPPPAVALKTAPRAGVVKGFVSAAMCDWLIARACPRLSRAAIYDGASSTPRADDSRTNSAMAFAGLDCDLPVLIVRARIAALIGLPVAALEDSSVLHYTPGQQFAPHYDFLDPSSPMHANAIVTEGQRVMTLLIYLNDDYEGGETDFPAVAWRFKGQKGDALLFWNILPGGQPDPMTRHAGLPPTSGEKWLFSQWIRCRIA